MMEQRHGDSISSPPTPGPLVLEAGQQASLLQVGGQAFLILPGAQPGQPGNTLQALPVNLIPVGSPSTPVLQTGGPQALQVDAVQSSVDHTDGGKPHLSQAGMGQPCVVQVGGGQPPTAQPQAVPTDKLNLKSQANAVLGGGIESSSGGVESSSGQSGRTTVAPPATLQHLAPKAKMEPAAAIPQILILDDGSPLRIQPSVIQIGGLSSSSVKVGCIVPTQQSNTFQSPASKAKANSRLKANVHPQPGAPAKFVHPGVLQGVPTVPIQPKIQDLSGQSPTGLTPALSTETVNLIRLAAQPFQAALLQPQLVPVGGIQPPTCPKNTQKSVSSKKNKPPSGKNISKAQQDVPTSAEVGCTAFSLVRMKHATTNTTKTNKSIGTQAKISQDHKSQAVQFPESEYGDPIQSYLQGSSWVRTAAPRVKVVIVRDPDPENASLFFESTRSVEDSAWNEELKRLMPGPSEMGQPHFDEVAVYFTEEEWACLSDKGKRLYKKVMMDNYWNLVAVGKISVTPTVIYKLERGEEPCVWSPRMSDSTPCPDPNSKEESRNIFKEHYNVQRFYERLKTITTPIRLTLAGLTVTKMTSDLSVPENKEDANSDSTHQCPFQSSLKVKPVINEKPFRCFKCERCFKRFGSLASHFRAHQKETDQTCPQCGTKFSRLKGLLLHYIKHTGERPFICSGCGKTFTSQIGLNNHLGVNQKKKQYECQQCGKRFSVKYSLLNHERIHDADNPNVCLICGKVFTQRSGLRLHQKVHDKPYICPDCGRCFIRKEECERHMRDHERMQLHHCADCGNAFIYERQLAEHRKVHEPNYDGGVVYPDLVIKMEEEEEGGGWHA